MRQAHYYMGLYSYTYSAGLVISTAGYLHLKNSETGAEDWLNLLKLGGSKTPLESAMIIGADISTDKPLRDTIQFLSDTVDQIIAYSASWESKGNREVVIELVWTVICLKIHV
ncbi:oligoendopeptidase F [Streptococcus pseudopneumoniae G42]|nr:oligoendopeptidase F [Streptococcus pseudopneumoniae G42]